MEDLTDSQKIVKLLESIKKWVSFFGITTIIIVSIYIVSMIYNFHVSKQDEIQNEYENRLHN